MQVIEQPQPRSHAHVSSSPQLCSQVQPLGHAGPPPGGSGGGTATGGGGAGGGGEGAGGGGPGGGVVGDGGKDGGGGPGGCVDSVGGEGAPTIGGCAVSEKADPSRRVCGGVSSCRQAPPPAAIRSRASGSLVVTDSRCAFTGADVSPTVEPEMRSIGLVGNVHSLPQAPIEGPLMLAPAVPPDALIRHALCSSFLASVRP
jgi:hypothetical protein